MEALSRQIKGVPMHILIPISPGELIDKITILEIKLNQIKDCSKLENIKKEYDLLSEAALQISLSDIQTEYKDLQYTNMKLWDIEDELRKLENVGGFGQRFIQLARDVYYTNDYRSTVKRRINEKLGSTIVEEKSYENYNG